MTQVNTVDVEAEASVLAALMTDPTAVDEVQPLLQPSDFATPAFSLIYAAVLECAAAGKSCDKVTIAAKLDQQGVLGRNVQQETLDKILDRGASGSALLTHVDIVGDRSKLRSVLHAAQVLASAASEDGATGATAIAVAEKTIFDLGSASEDRRDSVPLNTSVSKFLAKARAYQPGALLGSSTGFTAIDAATQGFQPGQLVILAARPGVGKTSMAAQLAISLARETGARVPFCSHEMTETQLSGRMLSAYTGLALSDLKKGNLTVKDEDRLVQVQEELGAIDVRLVESPPKTIGEYRSFLRREHRKCPLGAFVVDYVQLVELMPDATKGRDSRAEELGKIVYGFKDLCKELGVPGIILSQLNRSIEGRIDKRPMSSDLRDSGALEQAADLIMFLHRPHVYDPNADPREAEVLITKQRDGEFPLTLKLKWNGRCARYETDQNHLGPVTVQQSGPKSGGAFY